MKKFSVSVVVGFLVLAAIAVSAKTSAEWQKELEKYQTKLTNITAELEVVEALLTRTAAEFADASARYTAAHATFNGLGYRLHNIDAAGYGFDEASLRRARVNVASARADVAELRGRLYPAQQRREAASNALNTAKRFMLETNETLNRLYRDVEERFVEADRAYHDIDLQIKLREVAVNHWRNVAIQIEDKVAEAEFVRVRDEALRLRVRVASLQRQRAETEKLAAAIVELLK